MDLIHRAGLTLDYQSIQTMLRWQNEKKIREAGCTITPVLAERTSLLKDSIWFGTGAIGPSMHVLLYAHGGGFCIGHARMFPGFLQQLIDGVQRADDASSSTSTAAASAPSSSPLGGMRVLSVEYPLAGDAFDGTGDGYLACPPQAAIEVVLAAFDYLVDEVGVPPERIILAGDSAGGNIALASAIALRDRKPQQQQPPPTPEHATGNGGTAAASQTAASPPPPRQRLPASLLLVSPWADLSDRSHVFTDPRSLVLERTDILTIAGIRRFRATIVGNVRNYRDQRRREGLPQLYEDERQYEANSTALGAAAHWLLSPVNADLHGLPPVHLTFGASELLSGDIRELRTRLRAAGVPVHSHSHPTLPHDFPTETQAYGRGAQQAVEAMVTFLVHTWTGDGALAGEQVQVPAATCDAGSTANGHEYAGTSSSHAARQRTNGHQ